MSAESISSETELDVEFAPPTELNVDTTELDRTELEPTDSEAAEEEAEPPPQSPFDEVDLKGNDDDESESDSLLYAVIHDGKQKKKVPQYRKTSEKSFAELKADIKRDMVNTSRSRSPRRSPAGFAEDNCATSSSVASGLFDKMEDEFNSWTEQIQPNRPLEQLLNQANPYNTYADDDMFGQVACDVENLLVNSSFADLSFYIGVTESPYRRWHDETIGHHRTYYSMRVIFAHHDGNVVASLERDLISMHRSSHLCRNVGKGGERVAKRDNFVRYIYVCFA
jgi:hypothetical protein